jgi:ATP-dependent helicase HrpB
VLRLYTGEDYLHRPEQDAPEILRADLAQLSLALRAMKIDGVHEVEWLDAPPEAAVERAESLLDRLGVTAEMAQKLARYPLPPRLSRILVEAMERGAGEDGCAAVALLSSGVQLPSNDLLAAMDMEQDFRTRQHVEQLRRIARPARQKHHEDDALLISVLAGFPDRVARRRAGSQVLLSGGASAELAGEPPQYEFMVAVDAEDRKDKPMPIIRMTSRIEPEWLIELFPDRVREDSSVIWNRAGERVDAVCALLYDELVIQESRGALPDADAAAELLAEKALEAGLQRFVDVAELNEFLARVEFAGFDQPDVPRALRELCKGLRSCRLGSPRVCKTFSE